MKEVKESEIELGTSGGLSGSCLGHQQVSVVCSCSMLTPVEGSKHHTTIVEQVMLFLFLMQDCNTCIELLLINNNNCC